MNRPRLTRLAALAVIALAATACNPVGTYLLNNERTNAAGTAGLRAADIPALDVAWTIKNGGSITGQPVVAEDRIHWGDWQGIQRAATLDGKVLWSADVGTTTSCYGTIGVASSPTIADVAGRRVVYVGGGDGVLYALDANSGARVWATRLGPSLGTFLWSSPAFLDGSIYIGVAAYGACPYVQGRVVKVDATTGAVTHDFDVVPDGCTGGGVTASPAIDNLNKTLYITTGNTDFRCEEPYTQAILRLNTADLSLGSFWSIPGTTFVNADWLATPTLFKATIAGQERQLVGGPAKDGNVYVLERDAIAGGPLWTKQIAVGGPDPTAGHGSIAPMAYDGTTLYAAGGTTTINGNECKGAVRAMAPATGEAKWAVCLAAPVLGAVGMGDGFIVIPSGPNLVFVETATGRTIRTWTATGLTNFRGPVTVSNGKVLAGNSNGTLIALQPKAAP